MGAAIRLNLLRPENRRMTRKPLSVRTRFEILKRDGMRCRYCGANPMQSKLHVDHVVPVVDGGTNDPANLVTACADCNLGKNKVPLHEKKYSLEQVVTDADRDHAQQIREYLALQRDVSEAKSEVVEEVLEAYRREVGDDPPHMLRPRVGKMVEEFGVARIVEAFRILARKTDQVRYNDDRVKYIYGILRRWRAGEDGPPPKPPAATPPEQLPPAEHVSPLLERCSAALVSTCDAIRARGGASSYDARREVAAAIAKAAGASPNGVRRFSVDAPWHKSLEILGITLHMEAKEKSVHYRVELTPGFNAGRAAFDFLTASLWDARDRTWRAGRRASPGDAIAELEALDDKREAISAWLNRYLKEETPGDK